MASFAKDSTIKKVPNIKIPELPTIEPIVNIKNPFGPKFGITPFRYGTLVVKKEAFKLPVPGEGLPRVIHYCADQSGCAFWRMIWPGDELMAHNKAVVLTLYQMVTYAQFYLGINAIRLQRQCTVEQVEFIKFLRNVTEEFKKNEKIKKGFRIIWEVDDIVFPSHTEDGSSDTDSIPAYNICRDAFCDPKIGERLIEMTKHVDEIVVVSDRMRKHYQKHLKYDKITVIPNYAPKSWLDRGYDAERVVQNYTANKKKPRILYAGSGTHFDVDNRVNQKDDFGEVVDYIIRDLIGPKKYQWIFLGGLPLKLRQFVNNGVEFHNWTAITEYPELLKSIKANVMIAPLANNTFNRAKANIKLTEGGSMGIPVIAQNLECYNSDGWKYLFDTTPEMFKHIDSILQNESTYAEASKYARDYADKHWLKDHLNEWELLYTTEYGSEERKKNEHFLRNNPEQFKQ